MLWCPHPFWAYQECGRTWWWWWWWRQERSMFIFDHLKTKFFLPRVFWISHNIKSQRAFWIGRDEKALLLQRRMAPSSVAGSALGWTPMQKVPSGKKGGTDDDLLWVIPSLPFSFIQSPTTRWAVSRMINERIYQQKRELCDSACFDPSILDEQQTTGTQASLHLVVFPNDTTTIVQWAHGQENKDIWCKN